MARWHFGQKRGKERRKEDFEFFFPPSGFVWKGGGGGGGGGSLRSEGEVQKWIKKKLNEQTTLRVFSWWWFGWDSLSLYFLRSMHMFCSVQCCDGGDEKRLDRDRKQTKQKQKKKHSLPVVSKRYAWLFSVLSKDEGRADELNWFGWEIESIVCSYLAVLANATGHQNETRGSERIHI